MKTVVTVEDGRVTIQVDDKQPIELPSSPPVNDTRGEMPHLHGLIANEKPRAFPPITNDELSMGKAIGLDAAGVARAKAEMRPERKPAVAPPPATPVERVQPETRPTERSCEVCGEDISHLHKLARICQSPECIKQKRKEANARYLGKPLPGRAGLVEILPPTPPVPRRIVEDEAAETQAAMDKQRAGFSDPWNCGMCQNAGDLCVMHENMTAQGKTPPKYVHQSGGIL